MEMAMAFLFFGAIVAVVLGWGVYYTHCEFRNKAQERQLAHAERIKAIETGNPLPDAEVAWAAADRTRARMVGLIGIFVPLLTVVAAVIATAILVALGGREGSQDMPLPFAGSFIPWYGKVLFVIWPVCGIVSLATVVLSTVGLRRRPSASLADGSPAPATYKKEREPV